MTPVLCCGFECGVVGPHCTALFGTASFSTSTVRSGARSLRVNPTAAGSSGAELTTTANAIAVVRFYVRYTTLPSVDALIYTFNSGGTQPTIAFKQSDSKIYPATIAAGVITFGSQGALITTGVWYRIDVKVDGTNNPTTIDVKVDGVALAQLTRANTSSAATQVLGQNTTTAVTEDVFFDDFILSNTAADYPIGAGYVNHFIPTSDGTHNVAGVNDFERSATGTDIINSTTTAFQLIDDVPLKSGVVTEYINLIAPPNATDYVEVIFGPASGISTPTAAPRAVDAIVAHASATTGTHNLRIALNDNGTLDDVLNTIVAPGTTAAYARKHYADPPSAASTWTLTGNGNFNNVRMRCFTSDAAPDPWWASAMIEAEFQEIVVIPNKIFQVKQAVNRANNY